MQEIYAIEIACFVLLVSLFVPQLIQAEIDAAIDGDTVASGTYFY